MSRIDFEASIDIPTPPEHVCAQYADVAQWPSWDPDLRWAELDGPFATGSSGTLQPAGGPKSRFRLSRVSLPQGFDIECKLPLCVMRFEHEVRGQGSHSRVTHRVVFEGLLAPLFARVIGSGMRKTLPTALAGLRARVATAA